MRAALALAALLLSFKSAHAANICGQNRTIGTQVMAALNLSYPGLEAVAAAQGAGDLDTACEALAAYYSAANTSSWLRIAPVTPGTGRVGKGSLVDNAVDRDLYYMGGVDTSGIIPRNADGGLDWLNKGPRNDVGACGPRLHYVCGSSPLHRETRPPPTFTRTRPQVACVRGSSPSLAHLSPLRAHAHAHAHP